MLFPLFLHAKTVLFTLVVFLRRADNLVAEKEAAGAGAAKDDLQKLTAETQTRGGKGGVK